MANQSAPVFGRAIQRRAKPGRAIPVSERLPEPGIPVLVFVPAHDGEADRQIRAVWCPPKTVEQDWECDGGEYDKKSRRYFFLAGWYEWTRCEGMHRALDGTPTYWWDPVMSPQG